MDDCLGAVVISPLTELSAFTAPERRIFAKHEYLGPTGSIKDRMVEWALIHAIQSGELKAGKEIAEASSGNTGAALLVGPASGSCLHVARQLPQSGNVLLILTDIGTKYSTKLQLWQDRLSISGD